MQPPDRSQPTIESDCSDASDPLEPGGPRRASLLVYARTGVRVHELAAGESALVGRIVPADILIDSVALSRRHARFSFDGETVQVEDLGSRNGTFVSGRRATSTRVRAGEEVVLGDVVISVHTQATSTVRPGFNSYERLEREIEDETLRARALGQSFAVMAIYVRNEASPGSAAGHLSRWAPRVRALLRPVDTVTAHGRQSLLALLPASTKAQCQHIGRQILALDACPALGIGIALFPHKGASPGSLIRDAQTAARSATDTSPLQFAGVTLRAASAEPVILAESTLRLFALVERVARNALPVLIQGETGTGKEVVATRLHQQSPRAAGRMVVINCAALPANLLETALFGHERGAFTGADTQRKGAFEEADGGTLFLDEVGELSPAAQAALLRVLESKRLSRVGSTREIAVDVRVLAATHRNLEEMVRAGAFREDLFYRLNTVIVTVPPLRERVDEILPLARSFLAQASESWNTSARELSRAAAQLLLAHPWKGNVRELRNAIEHAAVVCSDGVIEAEDLPERLRPPEAVRGTGPSQAAPSLLPPVALAGHTFKDQVRSFETKLITDALDATGGNQSRAAEVLQIPLRTLVHKLKAYGIRRATEAQPHGNEEPHVHAYEDEDGPVAD